MLNMPKTTGPFATLRCKWKFSGLRIGGTNRNLRAILKIISKLPPSRDYPR
jgi:ribosome-associated toxin RatA of RatAB toxin-antitoxin module